MNPRDIIKLLLPPIVLKGLKNFQGRQDYDFGISGDYHSWHEALQASTGYDAEVILEKTRDALLKVKKGEAKYERDSVLFDEIQYSWPVLAGLMWVAAQYQGHLNVLDFGGSLGSTYYQNRVFLRDLPEIRWNIIEQPEHVKIGKEYFEDDVLKFYPNIEMCMSESKPNVILLSGVLQYLEKPYEMLNKMLDLSIDHIIIDRTPFWDGSTDRLCVQKVPPTVYPASYPIWVLSNQIFFNYFRNKNFEIIAEFQSLDLLKAPVHAIWKGMILKGKNLF